MKKFHMIIDLEKCAGCFNCFLACKDEHVGNEWLPYTKEQQKHDMKWIDVKVHERGVAPYTEITYVTQTCQHCDNAPCEKKYPEVFQKRSDGIMLIDINKANDPKYADACPYGCVSWNETAQNVQKCTGCAHLIDGDWKEPRCVQACATRAMQTVFCEDAEWDRLVERQGLKPITDGSNKPRILYKNLYMYNKCFVKGVVSTYVDGLEEGVIDAKVELKIGNETIYECRTDYLGEFYIDRIPKNTGKMAVVITAEGAEPLTRDFEIQDKSIVLDPILIGEGEAKANVILPNEHALQQALDHMTSYDAEDARKAFAKEKK